MTRFDLNNYPLWTALITPLTSEGAVDYASLALLVEQQQAADNGILLLGSTGEGLALSSEEQRHIVEYVVSLKLEVPLMVAVGGFDLQQQQRWIQFCNGLAIDAYLLASPIYAKPGKNGQLLWFSQLLEVADKPCMIYNVPSRTGVSLAAQTLAQLCEFDCFWAIKEASGDLALFNQYRIACPNIRLFSGDDGLFPQHASDNAAGLVSVCANAWPQATNDYVKHHLANRSEPIAQQWSSAIDSLFSVSNPVPVKALMHHLQVIDTPYLRSPLTHLELASTAEVVDADQSINCWLNQHNTTVSSVTNNTQER
jgi:4-hydroxy-tetrahydrodipicolinate synthase